MASSGQFRADSFGTAILVGQVSGRQFPERAKMQGGGVPFGASQRVQGGVHLPISAAWLRSPDFF
ncbi:hypothetical protein CDV50_15650 [Haematobacter massiliensis]|nr:hypothetical protein CDV50_15650 [Haematobacter massiliensis]OWJ82685.1 hypothetical protein CDV51_17395 [Haematobacter massiliensis]